MKHIPSPRIAIRGLGCLPRISSDSRQPTPEGRQAKMLKHYLGLPRSVHILCLGSFVNRAGAFVVIFLTLYLHRELDLGVQFATRAMGAWGVGSVLAALVGGHLADKIGRRTVMLFSMFGGAATLVILSFTTTSGAIMLLLPIFGLVSEMYRPAVSAMIADIVTPIQRSHAFGLMYVSINLGFAVGAALGGLIADHDFQWLFWGDALTAAAYGLVILVAIRETLPNRVSHIEKSDAASAVATPNESDSPNSRVPDDPVQGQRPVSLRAAALHIITDIPFVVFCLGTFLVGLVFMQSICTLPIYLEGMGFQPHVYGSLIAVNGLMIVCCQLPLTSLLGRYHRGGVLTLGAAILAVGFGLTAGAGALWHFALTIVIWTVGEMMMAPFSPAIVSDLAPISLRARYMGVSTMAFSGAAVVAAPLGGVILGHPGLGGVWLWVGTFVAGMTAAALFFSVRRQLAVRPD